MKALTSLRKIWFLAALLPALFLSGCVKDKFDVPEIVVPKFDLPAGATLISIMELKARHTVAGALDSINDNVYIRGIVIGNDEFGNIYKTLVIQDTSGGIELKLNKTSLYTDYKQGQEIYVKCQGLVLGDYNGLIQLGSVYNGGIGQLAEVYFPEHLFKNGLPGSLPTPEVITNSGLLTTDKISTLVRFDGASFEEAGQAYVAMAEDNTNRTLNVTGGTIIVRTSKYATFATTIMPSGLGSVVAILGYYNGDYQLAIRNTTDVFGFIPDNKVTLISQMFDTDPAWVTYSVASNKNWSYSSTYLCMVANNYGGDVAGEDWLFTPEIDLNGMDSAWFDFRTWSKFADAGMPNALQVMVSSNYTIGNPPSSATWTTLTCTLCPYSQSWTASGKIDLTGFVGSKIRIAWKYSSSGTASGSASQWEVDAVTMVGKHS